MVKLSIIIPSYNTSELTKQTLDILFPFLSSLPFDVEVVVVDNHSEDSSVSMLKKYKSHSSNIFFRTLFNDKNYGYACANNKALEKVNGTYVLFLNSDVLIKNVDFNELITIMDNQADIGGLTVKVLLPTGSIDPASHRGFPTVWNSFCYYSQLEKISASVPFLNSLFGGYHLTARNLETVHEIDSPTGAFFLVRKSLLDVLKGFDEDFFMYGEDIDLSYRIKKKNYKIMYYPKYTVLHLKNVSGFKNKNENIQKKTRHYFYDAMKIFYKKHYEKLYPRIISKCVFLFIDLKERLA